MLASLLPAFEDQQGQDKETKINLKFVKYVVKWGNNLLVKNNEIGERYYILAVTTVATRELVRVGAFSYSYG